MATATQILARLKGLNVKDLVTESIMETADRYVELNLAQLLQGKDGNDQPLRPSYARARYARVKFEMNPAPGYGNPDARLTGAFYKGYGVRVEGDQVIKDSNVEYADDLFEKYGNAIGQLDEERHQEYTEEDLAPVLYEKFREQTGLI